MSDSRAARIAADKAARRLAQSEFSQPVVVVAGAGTGKTALLVARVAAWCIGPGWELHAAEGVRPEDVARGVIDGVVAITFTEAAAAEMAHKIAGGFLELAKGEGGKIPDGWDPDPDQLPEEPTEVLLRARALANEGHRLEVSTIHAFCQRLLATHPFEAGLHPHFEVDADGARLEMLIEEVVEDALRDLVDHPLRSAWERLAAEGTGPQQIGEALRALVDAGANPAIFEPDPYDDDAAIVTFSRLTAAVDAAKAAVGDRLAEVSGDVSEATRDALEDLHAWLTALPDQPTFDDLTSVAGALDDRVIKRLEKWGNSDFGASEGRLLGEATYAVATASGELAALLEPLVVAQKEHLGAARAVLAPLLAIVEEQRTATGIVTFNDLLRRADRLLRDSPGACREVVATIDQLLVDEFQDTDDVQCSIIERLALDGAMDHRPGVFIVGDPKQSIYSWRDADLAAYDAFLEMVGVRGGKIVNLVRNFRSVKPILDEVERIVEPVMHEERGIQPRFEVLEATDERFDSPGFNRQPWSAIEHWLAWPAGEDGVAPEKGRGDSTTTAIEAQAIAADIRRLRDEGGIEKWGDVAVLLRVTTAQEELLKAFRQRGVPYEVAREREFYRQREVVEAAALVRCVLEPTDLVALLTVLRSDVIGVPDAALAPLWDAGFAARVARLQSPAPEALGAIGDCIAKADERTPDNLPGGDIVRQWPKGLAAGVEIIAELRRALREEPPDVFTELLRTRWLAEMTAACRYLGHFRRARLDRFFADLEANLVAGDGGDADLARFLRRSVEEGGESVLPVTPDLETDAVHVMTIHGAKGLDFEHVYVAQIHKGGRHGDRKPPTTVRRAGDGFEYRLLGAATPGLAAEERLPRRKAKAELIRLLYVATTRAKQRLVLSGGWREPAKPIDSARAASFAHLLAGRADSEAVRAQVEAGNERESGLEVGVIRVLPAFGELPSEDGHEADSLAGDEVAMGLRLAATLARARTDAAERMEHPLLRSASAEAHERLRIAAVEVGEPPAAMAGDRAPAMAVGTAIHGLLENLDLARELAQQVREQRESVIVGTVEAVVGADSEAMRGRLEDILAKVESGSCLARLEVVAPGVIARELPVLLWVENEEGPDGVISGFVDLVYEDPDDGRVVVADYKTDQVEAGNALEERARIYESQVKTYARAVRLALSLDHEPHTELWFLDADRIVRF